MLVRLLVVAVISLALFACGASSGSGHGAANNAAPPPPPPQTPQEPQPPQPPAAVNASSPVGTNLHKITGGEALWFIDQMPRAEGWLTQCDTCEWDTQEQAKLVLDDNGWIRSFGPESARRFRHASLLLYAGIGQYAPAGRWIVLYDGEGTLEYDWLASKNSELSRPGRDVIEVTPQEGYMLRIRLTSTNPANHLRNIRIILPGGICGGDPFSYGADAAACGDASFEPFEEIYDTQRFHPLFLSELRNYKALRFMQYQGVIEDMTPRTWSQRSKVTDAIWGKGWSDGSPPLEPMFELSNLIKADPWVHVPYWASDDWVRQFARLARERSDASRKVYLEYSNELWNTAWPYNASGSIVERWAEERWPAPAHPESGFTKRMNWFGMRSAQICSIWKEEWGSERDRVRCVMGGGPWDYPGAEALACPKYAAENGGRNCAADMWALAAAPYFGGYLGTPQHMAALQSWSTQPDGGLDTLFRELRTGAVLDDADNQQGALPAIARVIQQNKQVAERFGLHLISYEGGQHLTPVGEVMDNVPVRNLLVAANRDPRMRQFYQDYLEEWRRQGGELFLHYNGVSVADGRFGSWGAKEYAGQPEAQAPKFGGIMDFIEANPCWWGGCSE